MVRAKVPGENQTDEKYFSKNTQGSDIYKITEVVKLLVKNVKKNKNSKQQEVALLGFAHVDI